MKSLITGTIPIVLCLCSGFGQTPPETNLSAVEAELIAPLSVRRLEAGAAVFARVTLDWIGPGCTLRAGAILEAKVEAVDRRKGDQESELALSFGRAQCGGPDMKPLNLVLAAVAEAPVEWANVPDSVYQLEIPNTGVSRGVGGAGAGGMALAHMELRGVIHRFPRSAKVKPGDTLGIKGMKLDMGTGPNRSSVFSAKSRDVTLDVFTQLLLVPASMVYRTVSITVPAEGAKAIQGEGPALSPSVPQNNLEVCAPPGCAVDLPVQARELEGHEAASIAVEPLGYEQRPRAVQEDFGDEETLAWLGPAQLLFAFNAHPLIRRAWSPNSNTLCRVIRAVVLDAGSRTVVRAVDWEITDTGRYLWPLDGNRILVHVGNELRVYGENLDFERSIPLGGPLSFVRIAPNGNVIVIATQRERHSAELHAKLREEFGGEPEEDVDVRFLDKGFSVIARASTVSGLLPPTLLNEGQVNMFSEPKMRYRLALTPWDSVGVTLAHFSSRCTPEVSSAAPDLLFLLTCDVATHVEQYRVLGANGKLLLRWDAWQPELGQEVVGGHGTGLFAIKVIRPVGDVVAGMEFKTTDLGSEEVRVYRAADGKRVLAVRVSEPSASYDSYAVSPDGSQLAVLSQSEIHLIPVPRP